VTAGWYEVLSVTSGVATLDRSPAATSTTGINITLGGALDGPITLAAAMVASNKAFIRSGAYSIGALATFGQSTVTPSTTVPFSHIIGYYQSRGDVDVNVNAANRPTITASAGTGCLSFTNGGWKVENLICDSGGLASSTSIKFSQINSWARNCLARGFTTIGINNVGGGVTDSCEATTTAASGTGIQAGSSGLICFNYIHDIPGTGINANATNQVIGNIIANLTNSGAGISTVSANVVVLGNTIYNVAGHGIRFGLSFPNLARGNLIAKYGTTSGFGLSSSGAAFPAQPAWDGNAYWPTTGSGMRSNVDDASTNAVDAVAAYANQYDVTLTADPFVNASGGDFRLNGVAGGGLACRGFGVPNRWPGLTIAGYPDLGAVQAQPGGIFVMEG
jgi:hypothetical protein